jgi:hypothetical protein
MTRLLHVPLDQLRALEKGCPGLLGAVTNCVQEGTDPTIRVIRIAPRGDRPRWYLAVGQQVLILDSSDLAAMAAAVPIFLVDLVEDLRQELAPLFDDGTLDAEVQKLIPFGPRSRDRGKPS